MDRKILFVYNADSSLEHQVFDFLHKAISPATYQCSLCAITHGTLRMKEEWKGFIKSLPVPVEFLYRNEFRRYHRGYKTTFPLILLQRGNQLETLVTSEALKTLDLEGLMSLLQRRLREKGWMV